MALFEPVIKRSYYPIGAEKKIRVRRFSITSQLGVTMGSYVVSAVWGTNQIIVIFI